MYDNLTLRLEGIETPPEIWIGRGTVFDLFGLTWQPRVGLCGKLTSFLARDRNLNFTLQRNEIKCRNSLQKHYAGNNYEHFILPQFEDAVKQIDQLTGLRWENARVIKIEYGLNLKTEFEPLSFLQCLLSYKGKPYQDMISNDAGICYGKKWYGYDYEIKGYDKRMESELRTGISPPYNVLRWEIGVKNLRHLRERKNPIAISFVKDLINTDVQQLLINDLKEKMINSSKKIITDLSQLTDTELRAIAIVENEPIMAELRRRSSRNAARVRKAHAGAFTKSRVMMTGENSIEKLLFSTVQV